MQLLQRCSADLHFPEHTASKSHSCGSMKVTQATNHTDVVAKSHHTHCATPQETCSHQGSSFYIYLTHKSGISLLGAQATQLLCCTATMFSLKRPWHSAFDVQNANELQCLIFGAVNIWGNQIEGCRFD